MIAAASGVTVLDVVTLVIAVLGLVLGIAGLGWQVRSWQYEGAKLRVDLRHAYPTGPRGMGPHQLLVYVRNVGRSPVEITGWGFQAQDGSSTIQPPHVLSDPLPQTLNGGHAIKFAADPDSLTTSLRRANLGPRVWPFVDTATLGRIKGEPFDVD